MSVASLTLTEAACLPSGLLNLMALSALAVVGVTAICLVLSLISTLTYAGNPSTSAVALLKRMAESVTVRTVLPTGLTS